MSMGSPTEHRARRTGRAAADADPFAELYFYKII